MVVVGIVGPQQSGKKSVAAALQRLHGFRCLRIQAVAPSKETADEETDKKQEGHFPSHANGDAAASYTEQQRLAAVAAMDHCMRNWREDFVVLGFTTLEQVNIFRQRPLFLLLAVNAPICERLRRAGASDPTVFLQEEDELMFGADRMQGGRGLYACMRQADVTVLADGGLPELEQKLKSLELTNPERRRPSWDAYFIRLASLAASRANCLKRRVGAIVVRNNRLVSTGYNGTHSAALNCLDGGCERCSDPSVRAGRQLEACSCIHAEANALLEAGLDRCLGGRLYVTCLPCLGCAKLTIQAGIKCVVYAEAYDAESGALKLLTDAGLEVYKFGDRHPSIPHAIVSYGD
ncbi:hypothetical protein Efla_007329 [Eimeria flavescens]